MMAFKRIAGLIIFLTMAHLSSIAQVKIIFDTDFGGDADDLGALVMLHNLHNRGECELLAVMSWSTDEYVIPAMDAVNRWYGNGDIPMGIRSYQSYTSDWHYTRPLAEALPHKLKINDVPLAVELYRKILSEQPGKSVTIVTVGPLANIRDLLMSGPDQYSGLTGKALIEEKVGKFVVMGGQFPTGDNEWNFNGDMPGVTRYVLENLTVPVVFSGFEIGVKIMTGERFHELDPGHPLYIGYKHFSEHASWMKDRYREGRISNNASYDQIAVLYAVRGGVGTWWDKVENGLCVAGEKGSNIWLESPRPTNHSYLVLKKNPEEIAQELYSLKLTDSRKMPTVNAVTGRESGNRNSNIGTLRKINEFEKISPIRKTQLGIEGEKFLINGKPTYEGRIWKTSDGREYLIEGLLMNARLVQGVFDDLNGLTRGQWAYPDTGEWDPDRNSDEFIRGMAVWRAHGLLGFTLNLQGGCPYGYCNGFPWDNSAFAADGSLRESFMLRAGRIIDRADELGMVVILGLFYFGEDQLLRDEEAIKLAVTNAATWVLQKGYTNVILEINNECSVGAYDHEILRCHRVHELIRLAKNIEVDGRSLYVSTSLAGGHVATDNIVEASDFVLIHGNGVQNPDRITAISAEIRQKSVYKPMPLVNNEDDIPWRNPDQGWGEHGNNFTASIKSYTGWGFFDFRLPSENNDYNLGFQSIPVNWQISSDRKRSFFNMLAEITGSTGLPAIDLTFSGNTGEQIEVKLSGGSPDINIVKTELIVNNKVVKASDQLITRYLSTITDQNLLAGEHWIKLRITCIFRGGEVEVESPYYKNPWWPYGGMRQN